MRDESQKEEILVNVTPREVRAALLENGILQEVHPIRHSNRKPPRPHQLPRRFSNRWILRKTK